MKKVVNIFYALQFLTSFITTLTIIRTRYIFYYLY